MLVLPMLPTGASRVPCATRPCPYAHTYHPPPHPATSPLAGRSRSHMNDAVAALAGLVTQFDVVDCGTLEPDGSRWAVGAGRYEDMTAFALPDEHAPGARQRGNHLFLTFSSPSCLSVTTSSASWVACWRSYEVYELVTKVPNVDTPMARVARARRWL